MRGAFAVLILLAGCNPGVTPRNQLPEARTEPPAKARPPAPDPQANRQDPPAGAEEATPPEAATPDPGLAAMSPYRRREYERGYRDCMTGNFDGERQGESYRIGCMAAQEAGDRRTR